jgi:ABC-type amino acid transport substrate-binding protein
MSRRRAALALLAAALGAAPAPAAEARRFERPGILSSVGQSSDIAVVKVLLNTRLQLGLDVKPLAQPADLSGQRTLVVVVGASSKGLGAVGLDVSREVDRARALLSAARARKIGVIALHTGGPSRRGTTTDGLIRAVVPLADQVVVVSSGNRDRIFQSVAEGRVPVLEVDSLSAVGDAVQSLFGGAHGR